MRACTAQFALMNQLYCVEMSVIYQFQFDAGPVKVQGLVLICKKLSTNILMMMMIILDDL